MFDSAELGFNFRLNRGETLGAGDIVERAQLVIVHVVI